MLIVICLLKDLLFLLLLFLIGWSDAYTMKIPNRYVAGLLLWWLINELVYREDGLLRILSASAIAALILLVSVLFRLLTKRKGIGAGDIKLFFTITLYRGFEQGLTLILVSCIFAVINLMLRAVKIHGSFIRSARIPSRFPFGPSIVCAAVLILLEAQVGKMGI